MRGNLFIVVIHEEQIKFKNVLAIFTVKNIRNIIDTERDINTKKIRRTISVGLKVRTFLLELGLKPKVTTVKF